MDDFESRRARSCPNEYQLNREDAGAGLSHYPIRRCHWEMEAATKKEETLIGIDRSKQRPRRRTSFWTCIMIFP